MALMNVGELFKYLNSESCSIFFQDVDSDSKDATVEKMMNDDVFITGAHQYVSDDDVIRSKIATKYDQLLKKKPRLVSPNELFLANQEGISKQLDSIKEHHQNRRDLLVSKHETLLTKINDQLDSHEEKEEIPEFDEDKGKHIVSGIYLKREGHLIKMTAPTYTVYY